MTAECEIIHKLSTNRNFHHPQNHRVNENTTELFKYADNVK